MNVVDNTFDFKVRDRLVKECRERNWKLLHSCTEDPRVMIDMITYCSHTMVQRAILIAPSKSVHCLTQFFLTYYNLLGLVVDQNGEKNVIC